MAGHSYTINGHTFTADHVLTPDEARQIQARLGGATAEATASTTTTPVSGAGLLPAIGQTLGSLGRRTVEGSRELAEAIRERRPGAALGATARGVLPAVAPGMVAAGLGTETISRMLPLGGEREAEQARNVGEFASLAAPVGPGIIRPAIGAVRAARAGQGAMDIGGGIAQAGARKELLKNFPRREGLGNYTDASAFADKAMPFFRAHLRDLEAAGPSEALTSLRKLVGEGDSLKPLIRAVRRDPAMVAKYLERWPDLQPALRQAHMGDLIGGATRKVGTQKGLLDIDGLIRRWGKLGSAEKSAVYGAKLAKEIDKTFGQMATLVMVPGEAGEKAVSVGANVGQKIMGALESAGIGYGTYRMVTGHVREGAAEIGTALLARVLVKNGGPDAINAIMTASRDPQLWARVAPALGKAVGMVLSQPDEPRASPMAMRPMSSPAAPRMPSSPGLDTPAGILASIENTVLPAGWRPGMAPVMR